MGPGSLACSHRPLPLHQVPASEPRRALPVTLTQGHVRPSQGLNENGTTVVYVTHGPALAALASRIVAVRDALIVEAD